MNAIKQSLVVVTGLLVIVINGQAQQTCNRHTEAQGGFSICVPDEWVVREREGQKYKMLFGASPENFSPNINFKEEMSNANLTDYVAAGIREILASKEKIGATSIEPAGQSDFTTDSGLAGVRATFRAEYKGYLVRTIQYYFDAGRGRKLILTCTGLEKTREVYDRVFERAAKSFRIE